MRIFITALFLFFLCDSLQAQEHLLSLGASVIGPNVSAEYELSPQASARLDVGFYFGESSAVTINPEYHFHKGNNAMNIGETGILMPYHGPGLLLLLDSNNNSYGVDFVWGLEYDVNEIPFEIFADAGPYLMVHPETVVSLRGSFGMRYKF